MNKILLAGLLLAALTGCKDERETGVKPTNVIDVSAVADPNSFAQPEKVRIEHIDLDLGVDMDARVLRGSALYRLQWLDERASELVLDTRGIDIRSVQGLDGKKWRDLKFKLDDEDAMYGSALRITMKQQLPQVRINYATRPEASGDDRQRTTVHVQPVAGHSCPFLGAPSGYPRRAFHLRCADPHRSVADGVDERRQRPQCEARR